jgi:hypothetical protein
MKKLDGPDRRSRPRAFTASVAAGGKNLIAISPHK